MSVLDVHVHVVSQTYMQRYVVACIACADKGPKQ